MVYVFPLEDDVSDPLVRGASLPVKVPPAINVDDLAALQPFLANTTLDKPLSTNDDLHDEPKDLDPDDPDDKMMMMMMRMSSWSTLIMPIGALPSSCPFSYLYLSAEDRFFFAIY